MIHHPDSKNLVSVLERFRQRASRWSGVVYRAALFPENAPQKAISLLAPSRSGLLRQGYDTRRSLT
jgi:hypothetical protein